MAVFIEQNSVVFVGFYCRVLKIYIIIIRQYIETSFQYQNQYNQLCLKFKLRKSVLFIFV